MSSFTIWIIIIAVPTILIYNLIAQRRDEERRAERLRLAEVHYRTGLDSLKRSPDSVDLRQKVLQAGRQYCALLRQDPGNNTTVDEVSIQNDIMVIIGNGKPRSGDY